MNGEPHSRPDTGCSDNTVRIRSAVILSKTRRAYLDITYASLHRPLAGSQLLIATA